MLDYKIKGSPALGIAGATLGFFVGFTAVVVIGGTINYSTFKQGLLASGISEALISLLVASPNLSGSVLRIPFAAWSDQIGARKPMLVLLLLSAVGLLGLLIFGFAVYPNVNGSHYPLLLVLGLVAGCGVATFSVGISQTSYWFPKKMQGKALAIFGGVGNTAPGVLSIILALSLPVIDVSGAYLVWFAILVAGIVVYYFTGTNAWSFQLEQHGSSTSDAEKIARAKGQELFSSHKLVESLKISARSWKNWVLVALYFTSFGSFIGLGAYFTNYWKSYHEITYGLYLNAMFIITASLVRVASGPACDKHGGSLVTKIGMLAILGGGIIMMCAVKGLLPLAILGTILLAVGMGMGNAGIFKLVPLAVPKAVGGASGWVGGLGGVGGFFIPYILGGIKDSMGPIGYAFGFIVLVLLAAIAIVLVYVLATAKETPAK
jgi:NNP family nitrate/nitrite transporter-like MFS transporter